MAIQIKPNQPDEKKEKDKLTRIRNNSREIEEQCERIDPLSTVGTSAMVFPEKISTVRSGMAVKHCSQRVVLDHPEFPFIFTGAENEFGQRSSWNIKATDDYQLMRVFRKFSAYPNSTTAYIFKNLRTGKYICKIIKPCEHLIEKFGFRMNNHMGGRMEGDILPKGTVIAQSSSYVNDNYCAGVNLRFAYAVLPELTEDAIVISTDAAKMLEYSFVDVVDVTLKNNAFLLNRYGDQNHYKPFPDIGEEVKNDVICSIRENSYMSSASEARIPHINDKAKFTHGGIIADIDIYTNVDLENEQLNYYLNEIRRWYSDIYAYISTIISDPNQDDTSLLDIYHQAEKYLTPATWVTKEYIQDTVIKFTVLQPKRIRHGQKIVGRFGNKSVIAKIVPTHLMPKTDDGRPIHMLANALAVPNRIIAFATYEATMTFMKERMEQHIRKMVQSGVSKDEIILLVRDFVYIFNHNEANELERLYKLNKDDVYNDIIKNGIYLQIPPFDEVCVRDAILEAYDKYPEIMKRYDVYTKLRHRWIKLDTPHAIGYQYTWVLKQEPAKYMSVVSVGRTTYYDHPVKTRQVNNNLRLFSDNPIKFGEYDTYNFLAGVGVRAFAKITSYFRGSQYEENSVLMSQLNNVGIDTSRYNKFPQLDNLKNVLRFMGVRLKQDIFGCRTIGNIDEEFEVMINNCRVKISIPDLRFMLIIHAHYLKYVQEIKGTVNLDIFYNKIINETDTFKNLSEEEIKRILEMFTEILPVLQQMKQYK